MASIFRRMFKVAESHAHAAMDNLEDPIKMTEQGIRDLKKNLQAAMVSLAQVEVAGHPHAKGGGGPQKAGRGLRAQGNADPQTDGGGGDGRG